MVSEGRKVAGFHCSSFTGSQGQPFLSVWLGGGHLLKGQGDGHTHTQPHQDPGSSPAALSSGSPSKPGDPSKGDGLVHHSMWPHRAHRHNNCPLPPKEQPPPETHRKRLMVPGLAFRAALSPLLRVPPRFAMADSLPSQPFLLHTQLHPQEMDSVARPSSLHASQLVPQLPLCHFESHWPGLGEFSSAGESSKGNGLVVVGVQAHLIGGWWGCHSQISPALGRPAASRQFLVFPPLCNGDMPTGQRLTPEGGRRRADRGRRRQGGRSRG